MRTLLAITALSIGILTSQAADDQPTPTAPTDAAAKRAEMIKKYDKDNDSRIDETEASAALLPVLFEKIDSDNDHKLSVAELTKIADSAGNSHHAAAGQDGSE